MRGFCVCCGKEGKVTTHHVLPKRIFGENGHTARLCSTCHVSLERFIREAENDFFRVRVKPSKTEAQRRMLRNEPQLYYTAFLDFMRR